MKQVEVIIEYAEVTHTDGARPREWWAKMVLPFETPVQKLRMMILDSESLKQKVDVIGAAAYLQIVSNALEARGMETAGIGNYEHGLAYRVVETKDLAWVLNEGNDQ